MAESLPFLCFPHHAQTTFNIVATLDASTFVSSLYGIIGTRPIGKQIPGHSITKGHLIEHAKVFRESAFEARLQSFVVFTFKYFHKCLTTLQFMFR